MSNNQEMSPNAATSPTEQPNPLHLSDEALEALVQQCRQEHQRRCAEILAAAADGSGIQPWEREWPLHDFDLHQHFSCDVPADPGLLGQLLTMLTWALSSPLAREALRRNGQPTNPGQHGLDSLREMRAALTCRQRELLALQQNSEGGEWLQSWPLGDFDLYEHITTSAEFKPDLFQLGELIEVTDWALAAPKIRPALEGQAELSPDQLAVLELTRDLAEALRVRRRRLLLEEARSCLAQAPATLAELEEQLG